ncbi:hypothetical protein NMD1_00650 [Novosphingobium sp. MD-1]|nr:hypothetical protein NMD1_00650 [Novosphingobium sp. MD-1]
MQCQGPAASHWLPYSPQNADNEGANRPDHPAKSSGGQGSFRI